MDDKREIKHTGQAPFRRPPPDEPERIGDGELDDEPLPQSETMIDDDDTVPDRSAEDSRPPRRADREFRAFETNE